MWQNHLHLLTLVEMDVGLLKDALTVATVAVYFSFKGSGLGAKIVMPSFYGKTTGYEVVLFSCSFANLGPRDLSRISYKCLSRTLIPFFPQIISTLR